MTNPLTDAPLGGPPADQNNVAPTIEAFDGALVASTVLTITFTGAHLGVDIENVSGASPIFYTVDGSTPSVTTSDELPGVAGSHQEVYFGAEVPAPVVKLISAGTPTYSVSGLDNIEANPNEGR